MPQEEQKFPVLTIPHFGHVQLAAGALGLGLGWRQVADRGVEQFAGLHFVRHLPFLRTGVQRLLRVGARVLAHAPDIVILSAGPTASCLANRLARAGVQAVDLGSAGGFLLKLLEGGR